MSSSSYTSLYPLDNEEEEGDEAVSQLMLNKRWGRMISEIEPKDSTLPTSISSSNNKHLDDLARCPPQSVREVEVVGPSSVEFDKMRFRN